VAKIVITTRQAAVSFYGGNRNIIAGAGEVRFRTALNDRPGVWRVTVIEVIQWGESKCRGHY
jgi:hypothetical protein